MRDLSINFIRNYIRIKYTQFQIHHVSFKGSENESIEQKQFGDVAR